MMIFFLLKTTYVIFGVVLWVKCTVLSDQKLSDIDKVFEHFYDNSGDRKHISHICSSTGILMSSFPDAFFNCEQQND